jgi:hypothetical protein
MEDEGFVDDDFIDDTAREYVARYGFAATAMLQERAAIALAAGDRLLAEAWSAMADTAELLLLGADRPGKFAG